ncbi:cytochrome b/b6 domain-containing protein [Paraferrimonas haliotis]|uniref:Cytochrome b561 bacterial/Ni-hydrogenase domain-containing protein n=1 Tax=Paraferrimonas haliotis TaxID=2013866 RepID=A0AA37WYV1_9GAMM|nr:cytochrome b/b6 domain-containing protein [Paraferrimonas haliotis]GLS84200.1 hypothetical protein GCM10007894_21770 [Paraferrimonas haliotis]
MLSRHRIPDLIKRCHWLAALVCLWLLATAHLVKMAKLRLSPGFWEYNHQVLGFVALAIALLFFVINCVNGKWRSHFGWLMGKVSWLVTDLKGLAKGKIPTAVEGGLLAAIEGLTMVLFLFVGITGALWQLSSGADAMRILEWHVNGAYVLIGTLVVHGLTALGHYIETFR